MRSFSVERAVAAPPAEVWVVLTHAAGYRRWNSTIESLEGEIIPGGEIRLRVKADPKRTFALEVSGFEPPRRMEWRGGMPLGLFVGVRRFELAPSGDGGTLFSMSETYHGLLAPLIARALPDLQPAFEAFAGDLKREAEKAK